MHRHAFVNDQRVPSRNSFACNGQTLRPERKALLLMFLPARSNPFPRPSIIVPRALLILPFIAALLVRHPDQHPLQAESCLGDGLLQVLATTITQRSPGLFYISFIPLAPLRRPIDRDRKDAIKENIEMRIYQPNPPSSNRRQRRKHKFLPHLQQAHTKPTSPNSPISWPLCAAAAGLPTSRCFAPLALPRLLDVLHFRRSSLARCQPLLCLLCFRLHSWRLVFHLWCQKRMMHHLEARRRRRLRRHDPCWKVRCD